MLTRMQAVALVPAVLIAIGAFLTGGPVPGLLCSAAVVIAGSIVYWWQGRSRAGV